MTCFWLTCAAPFHVIFTKYMLFNFTTAPIPQRTLKIIPVTTTNIPFTTTNIMIFLAG